MDTNRERYQAWADAMFQALVDGDVEVMALKWADDGSYTSIHPFGEHTTRRGRQAIRQAVTEMTEQAHDLQVLKNEVLSASDERGILNAWVKWTTDDGTEFACDFIYIVALDEANRCTSYQEWNVVGSRAAK
jgi:ketosteroid isomerase-like protein